MADNGKIGNGKIGGFDGGRNERLLRGMPSTQRQINSLIRTWGPRVLARSRYLCANDAQIASAKASFAAALVGEGIVPMPLTKDKGLKEELRTLWRDWTDEADADGLTDLYGLEALLARELFEAGEVFVRFRPRRASDGLTIPVQLQVLPSEMLAVNLNTMLPGGGYMQCGIQFNAIGQRTAYQFYRNHPFSDLQPAIGTLYTTVPADEVLHIFLPEQAGQIRGIPRTLSIMVTAAMRRQYMLGELTRMNIAAAFAAFITRPSPEDAEGGPLAGQKADAAADGVDNAISMEPGSVSELAEGEEITFSTPPQVATTFEPFIKTANLEIATGIGVPYAAMTGDLSNSSYGSQRGGMIEQKRRIQPTQSHVMVFQFCRPVWNRFLAEAALNGALGLSATAFLGRRRELQRVEWIPPKWDWIDPLKDLQAEVLAVDNGMTARSDVIQSQGQNPEEVDQRRKEDQDREAELGILNVGKPTIRPPVSGPADTNAPAADVTAPPPPADGSDPNADPNGGPDNGA